LSCFSRVVLFYAGSGHGVCVCVRVRSFCVWVGGCHVRCRDLLSVEYFWSSRAARTSNVVQYRKLPGIVSGDVTQISISDLDEQIGHISYLRSRYSTIRWQQATFQSVETGYLLIHYAKVSTWIVCIAIKKQTNKNVHTQLIICILKKRMYVLCISFYSLAWFEVLYVVENMPVEK
jgi:hypothetical protein